MMNPKYFLLLASLFVSTGAFADSSDGILRNADGSIRYMNQRDAVAACAAAGKRLPTVREFAVESQSLGARGILKNTDGSIVTREQVESGSVQRPAGYYLVSSLIDSSKPAAPDNVDEFYFCYYGYQRSQGDLGNEWFWSSSVYSSYFSDYAYVLPGNDGYVYGFHRDNFNYAVRCVAGQ